MGCGDGRVTNRLLSQCSQVVGLDGSREALQHVRAEKLRGSIDALPFPDHSFDLVLCCEVLEHLPFKVYPEALEELQRVAKRYIIVSVPNSQDLKQGMVTCPHCGCIFHPWRHLRSFNHRIMKGLFSQFDMRNLRFCQPSDKTYPGFLIRAARLLRLTPSYPTTALCPQCGYFSLPADNVPSGAHTVTSSNDSLLIRLLRLLARWLIPAMKRGGWLMALYRRGQRARVYRTGR